MKNIVKSFGFIAVLSIIPGAFAATTANSRVGIVTKASARLPVIRRTSATTTIADILPKADAYMSNSECIEAYTDCLRGDDACGPDMEECTTRVLLHGQMPKCTSVLSQCTDASIVELFGTSKSNLSSGVKYAANSQGKEDKDREVIDFTYPSDSSVVGQMVLGAKVANQLPTDQCVKKYNACLKKDSVCGEDFELCTDEDEFKKQAVLCNSVFARCQNDGKKELFGSVADAEKLKPTNKSPLGMAITNGGELAAMNTVSTCYKVADQCIVSVCSQSPLACIAGVTTEQITTSEKISGESGEVSFGKLKKAFGEGDITTVTTQREVNSFVKEYCSDKVGSNKYCYITANDGKKPTKKQLMDPEVRDDTFDAIYEIRKSKVQTRLDSIANDFDKKSKDKCNETIAACAMRTCGGGIGSVCYTKVFGERGEKVDGSIAGTNTYDSIKTACAPIVNMDENCQYAYAAVKGDSIYAYTYSEASAFDTLFPMQEKKSDPIGAVKSLDARLASAYNAAAIAQMKKQCSNTVTSCVKSMCGTDYVKCYRNRTDIKSGTAATYGDNDEYAGANTGSSYGTYATSQRSLDKSMNRVGGILDYNIVIGLCMNTVKNSSTCEEHLKVAAAKWLESEQQDNSSWKRSTWEDGRSYASVRNAWVDANTTSATVVDTVTDYTIVVNYESATDNPVCAGRTVSVDNKGFIDADGCEYSKPVYQSYDEYALENVGTSLFQEVLKDVEREVQAKYNAKLTQEQNVCLANNQGGIRGGGENGSSFMWVKLNGNKKVPGNYAVKGLTTKDFTASNDLYGSFCRVRVTLMSDDKAVQEVLSDSSYANDATAYFAVGDAFTCGSWLSDKTLKKITEKVGDKKLYEEGWKTADGKDSVKTKSILAWSTVGGFVAGGLGGYFGMDALQKNENSLGGLLGNSGLKDKKDYDKLYEKCESNMVKASDSAKNIKGYITSRDAPTCDASCKANYEEKISSEVINGNSYLTSAARNIRDGGGTPGTYSLTEQGNITALDCQQVYSDYDSSDSNDGLSRRDKNLIAGAAMSAVGTALGAGISSTVVDLKKEQIANEAVKEWMETVGDHIKCYVGNEELGSYGDIINFNID